MPHSIRLMFLSLEGLALGDAFGEQFFNRANAKYFHAQALPPGEWKWTDDTHMALSIVEMLKEEGSIDPDRLAKKFAFRYSQQPWRGYGWGAARLLRAVAEGGDWRKLAPALFKGGSYGNGAAMRIAPLGAFFKDDFQRLINEARKSAMVTHAHPEGQAGAIAVAVAAGLAARKAKLTGSDFIAAVSEWAPESVVRDKLILATRMEAEDFENAVQTLGTGRRVSAQDTVPFCVWCAAHFGHHFETALWKCVAGRGDVDTTCAIVGGIAALRCGRLPKNWLEHREPLEI
ncbi:ADP-ribosylglycohydrolase family protein [Calditrichota bacterium LG25]